MTIKEAFPDAHITYQRNKKTGAVYVYSVQSYWDKEKKAPRNKQLYLGKLNQETGELIPSTRRKPRKKEKAPGSEGAVAKVAGPCLPSGQMKRSVNSSRRYRHIELGNISAFSYKKIGRAHV